MHGWFLKFKNIISMFIHLNQRVCSPRVWIIKTIASITFAAKSAYRCWLFLVPWGFFAFINYAIPNQSIAQSIYPLSVTNTNPVVLVQGIPATSSANVVDRNETHVGVDYEVSSHYSLDKSDTEQVLFDGETTRATVSIKKGIAKRWDLELLIPYLAHNGGNLDGFIDDWHALFDLPQNGRNKVARNKLHYFYQKKGETLLDIKQANSGVGDIQLVLSWQLMNQVSPQREQLAFKTAVKFPTGDADRLLGSGALSLSVWVAANTHAQWFGFKGSHYGSLGATLLGKGEILSDQQRRFALFGGLGSGARISKSIVLQAQLDANTSLYSGSDFVEINSVALQLTIGGKVEINRQWNIDLSVVEDLVVHASPDVIFHLGINGHF